MSSHDKVLGATDQQACDFSSRLEAKKISPESFVVHFLIIGCFGLEVFS